MSSENGEETRSGFLPTALAALAGTAVGNAVRKLIIARLPAGEDDDARDDT